MAGTNKVLDTPPCAQPQQNNNPFGGPGQFPEIARIFSGNIRDFSTNMLEGASPRVANPRVGSGAGFGGPGGGSGGPGGGFVIVVKVMAKPLLRLLRRNHRQDHQNHQNQYQNPLGG